MIPRPPHSKIWGLTLMNRSGETLQTLKTGASAIILHRCSETTFLVCY